MPRKLLKHEVDRALDGMGAHLSVDGDRALRKIADVVFAASSGATVADVLKAVYPDVGLDTANRSFLRIRKDLDAAAHASGVSLAMRVDGPKSAGAEGRRVWFEGDVRVVAVQRTDAADAIPERELISGQLAKRLNNEPKIALTEVRDGKPVVRWFFSYAHADKTWPDKLWRQLDVRLRLDQKYAFEGWIDGHLLVGEDFDRRIRDALAEAQIGVFALSPECLASEYVKSVEIARYVAGSRMSNDAGGYLVPVALKHLNLRRMDLGDLVGKQIYFGSNNKAYHEIRRPPDRETWVEGLATHIRNIVDKYGILALDPVGSVPWECDRTAKPRRGLDTDVAGPPVPQALPMARPRMPDLYSAGVLLDGNAVRRELRDPSPALGGRPSGDTEVALDMLLDWLRDPGAPPLFAVLGEYGSGKTVTCQRFFREVEKHRANDEPSLPVPYYFDLRHLTGLSAAARPPTVSEVIAECIKRGWELGVEHVLADDLLKLAKETPSLFIFDGLDEALVHLSASEGATFARELLRLLPRDGGMHSATRVVISCRNHAFRSLGEQEARFTEADRGRATAEKYAAMELLPLTLPQIREYLQAAVPSLDVARTFEMLDAVHDLRDLAGRPYTLKLISELLPELDRRQAAGSTLLAFTLYSMFVERWLERDLGKHQLRADHKLRLMEYLAAWMWSRGQRTVPVEELEDWLHEWRGTHPKYGRRYHNANPDKLEEDLRTATFLVREDGDAPGFRFAHTSMLEYFLACHLLHALDADEPESWVVPRPSVETWHFFGQGLLESNTETRLTRLSAWRSCGVVEARHHLLRYATIAAERGLPVPELRGADLSGIELDGATLRTALDLRETRWDGAMLFGTDWRGARLRGASFREAILECSTWDGVDAADVDFSAASLHGATFRRTSLAGSVWMEAVGFDVSFIGSDPPEGTGALTDRKVVNPSASPHAPDACVSWLPAHVAGVVDGGLSPDGVHAVTMDWAGVVRIWRIEGRTALAEWTAHPSGGLGCSWLPCGKRLVTSGMDGSLRVWETATGRCVSRVAVADAKLRGLRVSPDGRTVVCGEVRVVGDVVEGEIWWVPLDANEPARTVRSGLMRDVVWIAEGALLVTSDGFVIGLDVAGKQVSEVRLPEADDLIAAAVRPDGRELVAVFRDDSVRVFRTTDVALEADWRVRGLGGTTGVSVRWPTDDDEIFLKDAKNGFAVRNVRSGRTCWRLPSRSGARLLGAFVGGEVLAQPWAGGLFRVAPGQPVALALATERVAQLRRCSANGTHVACLSAAGLWVLDASSGLVVHHTHRVNGHWARDLAWSSGTAELWGLGFQEAGPLCGSSDESRRVLEPMHADYASWSRDGRAFAVRELRTTHGGVCVVRLDDVESPPARIDVSESTQLPVVSPDGHVVVAIDFGERGAELVRWSVGATRWERVATVASDDPLGRVWWSPKGQEVWYANRTRCVRVAVESGAVTTTEVPVRYGHCDPRFSADGSMLAFSNDDGAIEVWTVDDEQPRHRLTGHRGGVTCLDWAPDGRTLWSTAWDGTLRAWDVASGTCTLVFATYGEHYVSYDPRPRGEGRGVIEASSGAWRWLRWLGVHESAPYSLEPAETFGELPPSRATQETS